jgi:hypothetical protein
MKLPRWLLWTMLTCSVVSALAAAGWWWVTWPDRTVRRFLDDSSYRNSIVESPGYLSQFPSLDRGMISHWTLALVDDYHQNHRLKPLPRTLLDMIMARQAFEIFEVNGHMYCIGAEGDALLLDLRPLYLISSIGKMNSPLIQREFSGHEFFFPMATRNQ